MPTIVRTPLLGGSANKTRDCGSYNHGSPLDHATCGCDYALHEQFRCTWLEHQSECGCYTCPHEFPQMAEVWHGASGGSGLVCYEPCPEAAGKPSHLSTVEKLTLARSNSTVTPSLTTPESFPAPTQGTEALNLSAPVGKECWEGGPEYESYHTKSCIYTSGTPEQNGHQCGEGAAGCECFCWGCADPQSQDGPMRVIQDDDDGRHIFMCFERCAHGASRRCADWSRPDTCRCYPEPEAGRLFELTQLKCCTPGSEGSECMDLISKQAVESAAISSIAKPADTDCESMPTPHMMRCWNSEHLHECAQGEAGCECRCYGCLDPQFPQYAWLDGELKCYAACPEHYEMRCDDGACACYSCSMMSAVWPPEAAFHSELRGVRSVLLAQCPDVSEHSGVLPKTEAWLIGEERIYIYMPLTFPTATVPCALSSV